MTGNEIPTPSSLRDPSVLRGEKRKICNREEWSSAKKKLEKVRSDLAVDKYWLILAAVIAVVVVQNSKDAIRRRRCMKMLYQRADLTWDNEYATILKRTAMPREDVERLWNAMAEEYGLPAEKIRSIDGIHDELYGGTHHPDYDPFLWPFFREDRKLADKLLQEVVDWADLIIAVYKLEQTVGRRATKETLKDGVTIHEWGT